MLRGKDKDFGFRHVFDKPTRHPGGDIMWQQVGCHNEKN